MYENMNMYISKAYLFAYANILYYSFFLLLFLMEIHFNKHAFVNIRL